MTAFWGWLQGPEAAKWLAELAGESLTDANILTALTRLRRQSSPAGRQLTPAQAAAVVATAQLRQAAAAKFPGQAERMFFSRTTLQQASPAIVAAHTARRFAARRTAASDWVADLGCGLGSDALALAAAGLNVLAIDRDPEAVALAALNAAALGYQDAIQVMQADVLHPAWRVPSAWADPGRRTEDRRLFDPEQLHPPLGQVLGEHRDQTSRLGVKLMPGLPHTAIPPEAEAEWISLHGELKEAVLWFGDFADPGVRRATLLPAGVELAATPAGHEPPPVALPGSYLYEPDPAVLRAGAVGHLALLLGLWQIDREIAYLSGRGPVITPFARSWRVIEHFAFDLKGLNRRLRDLRGEVIAVKKRGSPLDPEAFRRRLASIPGGLPLVVVLTRVQNRPWILICEPASAIGRPPERPPEKPSEEPPEGNPT